MKKGLLLIIFFTLIFNICNTLAFSAYTKIQPKKIFLSAQTEIAKMDEEEKIMSSEECCIEILGFEDNIFGIVVALLEKPPIIETFWQSPQNGQKEFESGMSIQLGKVGKNFFAYLIKADLDEIPLDDFILGVRYLQKETHITYTHSIIIHKKRAAAELIK